MPEHGDRGAALMEFPEHIHDIFDVTGIEIVNPQVTLLKNRSGKWNF
jgi:hypothetical protein